MAILQQNPPRLCNRLRRQLHLCLRTVGVQTVRSPETSQLGNAVFIGMQLPLGSPLLMNQPLQFLVTGLGRIVRPQQTAGRIQPRTVGKVPSGNCFHLRMREKDLVHFPPFPALPFFSFGGGWLGLDLVIV